MGLFSGRFLLIPALVVTAAITSPTAAPNISVVGDSEFDAGSVLEGKQESIKHIFKIKNTGDAPLKISQVKAG